MDNTENTVSIEKSWSLLAFAKEFGKMQVGNFANQETGETFKSCIFTDNEGSRTFVSFSSKLGELSPAEISSQKSELQVVKLTSGSYKLCSSNNGWQNVDL